MNDPVNDLVTGVVSNYNYWFYVLLMMIGMYAMIAKSNLVKKVIGMNIFQTAIILFFISMGVKKGATIPIVPHGSGGDVQAVHAIDYINPLPHALMLTAIVVSVATLGVALALAIKIHRRYGTLEEDEIIERMRR